MSLIDNKAFSFYAYDNNWLLVDLICLLNISTL